MGRSHFTENATGQLVRIESPIQDYAFIPHELPPKWAFPAALYPLLVQAKEALGTLNGIGQTLPVPQLLLRPLQSREAITSSNIEGTFVTPEQLLLFEIDPREPRSADDKQADWLEVSNYGQALRQGFEMLNSGTPIGNHLITGMHGLLMEGVRGEGKSPGRYREQQVQIGSRGRFIPPPPGEVGRLMTNLNDYGGSDDGTLDPLVKACIVHCQFEAIHPFADGNGRVGRALLSLTICKWHNHAQPWLYLSPYFEEFNDEYVERMYRVSANGEWSEWIEFCLRGVIAQSHDAIQRCRKFRCLRDEFHGRIQAPTARSHRLVENLFVNPVVTITGIARQFGTTYHTARSDVAALVEAGILKALATRRPKAYYAPEIMRIAYGPSSELKE
ncbi:MAG: Fic family protein [Planctomyces sp.]|nr:Fic family protein [Planctomyces sp.]